MAGKSAITTNLSFRIPNQMADLMRQRATGITLHEYARTLLHDAVYAEPAKLAEVKPADTVSTATAQLAEEITSLKSQLVDKDAEIARLKEETGELQAKLEEAAQEPELSDDERFQLLTSEILGLSKEGRARLAEVIGFKWPEEVPLLTAPLRLRVPGIMAEILRSPDSVRLAETPPPTEPLPAAEPEKVVARRRRVVLVYRG